MPEHPRDTALAVLARERGEALTRYAYLLTGDVAAAQDLVQDALTKVLVRARAGTEVEALEAYVRKAIAMLFVDGHRRRRAWRSRQHLVVDRDLVQGPDVGGADSIDLRAALATLGRQERAAVVLRYYEDLTVAEVADRMGLAEGTVKRYLHNAVRRLEERVGPVAGNAPDADEYLTLTTAPRRTR